MVSKTPKTTKKSSQSKATAKPPLLSGDNPQIPKGDGEAPVQAYIDAIPGWRQEIARRLDALAVSAVPSLHKGMRWNSPFYGIKGRGWIMGFHVFTKYIKVTFFQGASLLPTPPGGTGKDARWIDVHEDDLDEAQMTAWLQKAATLPGWGKI